MSEMKAPPNFPVIVVHLDDGNGLTVCTGHPMPEPVADKHFKVPRYFCRACAGVNLRSPRDAE